MNKPKLYINLAILFNFVSFLLSLIFGFTGVPFYWIGGPITVTFLALGFSFLSIWILTKTRQTK